MGAKYIVASNDFSGEMIFPFSAVINHRDMAFAVKKLGYRKIISAGFVDEFMQCYGESTTLKIKSRDIDTILLKCTFEINDKKLSFTD